MHSYKYNKGLRRSRKHVIFLLTALLLLAISTGVAYKFLAPESSERAVNQLQFDNSVTEKEKDIIRDAVKNQSKSFDGTLNVSIDSVFDASANDSLVLSAYVPVTNSYAVRQSVSNEELKTLGLLVPEDTDEITRNGLASALGVDVANISYLESELEDMTDNQIALVPSSSLSQAVKLLRLNDVYYLDNFSKGAVFRNVIFSGDGINTVADLSLNNLFSNDTTLKVNMTGVTALTRVMQKRLLSVKDPLYFSAQIGDFLADADITHVSNEVSFKQSCLYSNTLFCSPPEFIETLKDSGVDLVEITGNHNNDNGSVYNQESINLYRSLGWNVFGGGLNTEDAAKPYLADKKSSKVAFIGYNMADGAGSGAIAGTTSAGANIFTEAKAVEDITAAKQSSQFVIVSIQYAECQAYPLGYVEFPECDGTIGGQEAAFRKMIDLGADMVVGSSAHQPQTYEIYKGKPIYYGLGNMYFDQTQWPGTERGIVLTHYFSNGKLLQTKLSPTVYDKNLQTRLMNNEEASYLLERLKAAR